MLDQILIVGPSINWPFPVFLIYITLLVILGAYLEYRLLLAITKFTSLHLYQKFVVAKFCPTEK